jgi:hypothetical protein
VLPISTEAVVLALLPVVGVAAALVVALVLLDVAVVPPGGLAVELQPASANAAIAGASAAAANLGERSIMLGRNVPRFPRLDGKTAVVASAGYLL